jgi:hypothetical protein
MGLGPRLDEIAGMTSLLPRSGFSYRHYQLLDLFQDPHASLWQPRNCVLAFMAADADVGRVFREGSAIKKPQQE